MSDRDLTAFRCQVDPGAEPPPTNGGFADAERLRKWSFRRRTPQQRYEWLLAMLKIAYSSGALKPRTEVDAESRE